MIRVGVFGAGGKMGSEVCRAVHASEDMALVAAVDMPFAGQPISQVASIASDVTVAEEAEALLAAETDVAVDFTVASSAVANTEWCIRNGISAVVGTTGISASDLDRLSSMAKGAGNGVLLAPNFAIGAVLMMRFAELAAGWMPDAEIIELHHPGKLDAPSGTALKTLEGIARGRTSSPVGEPAGAKETVAGARGATTDDVHVHSVRLPGMVAHQEVIFGGQGQTLSIRHDSIDRTSFMPGVLLAVRKVGELNGLVVGLEHLLGI